MTFPEVKFTSTNSIDEQCLHVVSEAIEASQEDDPYKKAMELWDVIHSAETGLRILSASGVHIEQAKIDVVIKNTARGYYGN